MTIYVVTNGKGEPIVNEKHVTLVFTVKTLAELEAAEFYGYPRTIEGFEQAKKDGWVDVRTFRQLAKS